LGLYLALAAIVYLVIGLILTIGVHKAVQYEYVSLKGPFPLTSALMGTAVGFFVYLVIFVMGMTFTKHGIMHVVVDIVWQMFEQGVGGLAVSLGIIWDMHKRFLEQERAN
jgi:TRAP-type mannitol/chloroaromatic compound transport system permease small subunit